MSDKISYILEVLDGYSKNTRKLKKELGTLESSLSSLDKKLNSTLVKFTKFEKLNFASTASQFEKMAKSMDKVSVATARAKKASSGFILVGSGSQITAVSAAEIRRQRSLKNAVVPFNNPFTMMGGGRSGGYYNPRGYNPNFKIPIDSTYRRDAAGTGIVPYSRGGAVMSYGQRPMIDVTGTGRIINQDPIYNSPSQPSQPQQTSRGGGLQRQGGFFGGGGGVSLANVAKGMGYYRAIAMAVSVPSKIHDVTIQMDGLRAGLAALIPTVKGMQGATSEGEVNYLRGVADKYGADFTTIAPSYLKLLGTGGASDAPLIKGLLENVSGYAGILNLDTPAFERTMLGFQDMLSKQVLNAQEVNLQMANLPGAKPMLHKAYKRYAEKRGAKGITDENASIYFTQAMASGKLSSVDILKEFVEVMKEMFGEDMIKKSFTLGREEKRLKNAFQELGDQIGLLTYDTQIGAVRGLTSFIKSVGSFTSGIAGFANDIMAIKNALFPEEKPKQKVENFRDKFADTYGQTVFDLAKLTTYGASKYGGALITAGAIAGRTGDTNPFKEYIDFVGEDFDKNYFRDKSGKNIFANDLSTIGGFMGMNNEPQKIEITIKSDNNIQVKDVKSNRPSTVKAGQK